MHSIGRGGKQPLTGRRRPREAPCVPYRTRGRPASSPAGQRQPEASVMGADLGERGRIRPRGQWHAPRLHLVDNAAAGHAPGRLDDHGWVADTSRTGPARAAPRRARPSSPRPCQRAGSSPGKRCLRVVPATMTLSTSPVRVTVSQRRLRHAGNEKPACSVCPP